MLVEPKLPYAVSALEPHMSAETLNFHYGKHHMTYFNNLKNLVASDDDYKNLDLLDIVKKSQKGPIFNNAAQVLNHSFFWDCLTPDLQKHKLSGDLLDLINKNFGSLEKFKLDFTEAAVKNFGSGWTWLLFNQSGDLEIKSTSNADTPFSDVNSGKVLLTIDVWEHAYYIDYRNIRPEYIKAFWEILNWQFVSENLSN